MPRFNSGRCGLVLALVGLAAPVVAHAQTSSGFEGATVEVVSEWTSQDRGDGSGTYHLTTRVTDPRAGVTIEHDLAADRTVKLEIESDESLVVMEGKTERARAGSDPAPLGGWSSAAASYVIPFDLEFNTDPVKSYRTRDRQVIDLIRSVSPQAKVSTRVTSDGRTTATVEVPGVLPVQELASQFVGIRTAFRDAEVGLAKLQIKGQADITGTEEVGSTQ
jgi:hypothetical protein